MASVFSVDRDDLINAAYRAVGSLGYNQTASATQLTNGAQALNLMVKSWMAKGATLWKIQEQVIPLVQGQVQYPFPLGAQLLRVLDVGNFVRNLTNASQPEDNPVTLLGRNEYEGYGQKCNQGVVNSFYFDPQIPTGELYVFPAPAQTGVYELHVFAQVPYNDFNVGTDTPDFPQEWFNALKWWLARELLIEEGADETTERRIERRYTECIADVFSFSVDEASMYFTYDNRGMR